MGLMAGYWDVRKFLALGAMYGPELIVPDTRKSRTRSNSASSPVASPPFHLFRLTLGTATVGAHSRVRGG